MPFNIEKLRKITCETDQKTRSKDQKCSRENEKGLEMKILHKEEQHILRSSRISRI